jgi:SAM-dependent methyltransferase
MGSEPQEILYWNEAAADYSSRQDELTSIYQPVLEEQLGDVSGKRILDAGCGDGSYSRNLASRGAIVFGIDGSSEMISIAKHCSGNPNVEYRLADLTTTLPFSNGSFDIILANMVLMDIPRIDLTISEFARLLSANGSLVLSIPHPCFFCSDWVMGETGQRLYKKVSDYMTPKVEVLNFWGKTLHFHRPLSRYFDELTKNAFHIEAFKEPMPSEEALEKHQGWECHRRVPSFVVMRAILKRT